MKPSPCTFCGGAHSLLHCPNWRAGKYPGYGPSIPLSERRVSELSPYALRAMLTERKRTP